MRLNALLWRLAVTVCFAGCPGSPAVDTTGPCRGVVLPADQHYVASGLCVRAVARNQGQLRQLTFASNGDLLGVRTTGTIWRYRDLNADGIFEGTDEVMQIADTHGNGNNVHLDGSHLYAGSETGVKRWAYSAESNDLGPGEDVMVGQPSDGDHTFHTVHVYDGFMYVHSGSLKNAIAPMSPEYDTNRSLLKRFALSAFVSGGPALQWADGEVYYRGLRNMVGYKRDAAGRMYGVVNGIDDLMLDGQDVHLDNPGEDVVLLTQGGAHGYPYCFTAQNIRRNDAQVPPGTQLATTVKPANSQFVNPHDDTWCAQNALPPLTFMPAHAAPLDIAFNDSSTSFKALPDEWRNGAFITLHGSWDTTPSVGHEVIFMPFDANGVPPMPTASSGTVTFPYTVVLGGGANGQHQTGVWHWSTGDWGEDPVRFVGVAVSPLDGALYVSSDNGSIPGTGTTPKHEGAIYRIRLDH